MGNKEYREYRGQYLWVNLRHFDKSVQVYVGRTKVEIKRSTKIPPPAPEMQGGGVKSPSWIERLYYRILKRQTVTWQSKIQARVETKLAQARNRIDDEIASQKVVNAVEILHHGR